MGDLHAGSTGFTNLAYVCHTGGFVSGADTATRRSDGAALGLSSRANSLQKQWRLQMCAERHSVCLTDMANWQCLPTTAELTFCAQHSPGTGLCCTPAVQTGMRKLLCRFCHS